jgi:hypothetical protein
VHVDQAPYRELYETLLRGDTTRVYPRLLVAWTAAHPAERDWLARFAERPGTPVPAASVEDLWRLYALHRVNETLLLRFQPGASAEETWPGPDLSVGEYVAFATGLGLSVVESAGFTPFFHEIVTVEEATDENQPPAVTGVLWPGLTLGPLLFSRAGVRVSAGRRLLRKDLAESSTLYWAHRRRNRPAADLSHGWGGNSQWRTSFRRDYAIDGELHFNVDADPDRRDMMPELTSGQRVELLTHRCIVTTEPPLSENDLWPYDDTLRSPRRPA